MNHSDHSKSVKVDYLLLEFMIIANITMPMHTIEIPIKTPRKNDFFSIKIFIQMITIYKVIQRIGR